VRARVREQHAVLQDSTHTYLVCCLNPGLNPCQHWCQHPARLATCILCCVLGLGGTAVGLQVQQRSWGDCTGLPRCRAREAATSRHTAQVHEREVTPRSGCLAAAAILLLLLLLLLLLCCGRAHKEDNVVRRGRAALACALARGCARPVNLHTHTVWRQPRSRWHNVMQVPRSCRSASTHRTKSRTVVSALASSSSTRRG
jgi:hypothetical protein